MTLELTKAQPLFERRTVADMSEYELEAINGGSNPLAPFAAAAALVYAGYQFGHWLYTVTHK